MTDATPVEFTDTDLEDLTALDVPVQPIPDETPIGPVDGPIRITPKKKAPANVYLGDVPYKALPLKSLVLVDMQRQAGAIQDHPEKMLELFASWMNRIFGKTVGPQVLERLRDPEDDLDIPDILELIKVLAKRSTGNPTS